MFTTKTEELVIPTQTFFTDKIPENQFPSQNLSLVARSEYLSPLSIVMFNFSPTRILKLILKN